MSTRLAFVIACCLALNTSAICVADDWSAARFDKQIATIIASRCLDCHSGSQAKGKLNLADKAGAFRGGESGKAVVAGKPQQSLIWKRIAAGEMPPKKPLPSKERQLIRSWIAAGAVWGTNPIDRFRYTTAKRSGYDWWSLQPIKRPKVPAAAAGRNPIDAFVRARLRASGLRPSPQASARVIIRRATFDLLGLPPKPQDVGKFEADFKLDPKTAMRKLVDRLLKSRHFGERWGRHWLDVVRFGESQGFERDKLRSNSWHYRDWVIDAMNRDMPYDQFARLQLAGDVLRPNDLKAVTATGFLVAGPWDEVGQSMRSLAMKAVVRQDEIEDYVGTIGQAFLGLTVNCARCHDHKFDPIRQEEYYRLASAIDGVRHGSREVISTSDRQRRTDLTSRLRRQQDKLAALESAVRIRLLRKRQSGKNSGKLAPYVAPIARWDFERGLNDQIGSAHAVQHPKAKRLGGNLVLNGTTGYAATHPIKLSLHEKTLEAWVKLDNLDQRGGAAISVHSTDGVQFDALVFGESEPKRWMAGSDFFKRTTSFRGPLETTTGQFVHVAITYHGDGTVVAFRNGKPYGRSYRKTPSPLTFSAKKWYVLFGLRCGGPDPKRQLRGLLECAQLYDRALTAEQIRASYLWEQSGITTREVVATMTSKEKSQRQRLQQVIQSLKKERGQFTSRSVYAAVPKKATVTHLLLRGNPARKGKVVTPGGVAAVRGVAANFGLAANSTDAKRRIQLAKWVTHPRNPLFARVIANRLWHYHFGDGLVQTPNDFGFNGGRPSHPKLLDYLASELIRSGWRLKHLHRLIVSSSTYLQDSRWRKECAAVDANNRLLWRKAPLRLEAEALRDSILLVSGQLNRQYGGPSYHDFRTFVNNTQFYESIDKDSKDVYRRTVYRTWSRSGRNPLLDAFDCPDPSTTAPKRTITTTPIQALTLMNNSFLLRMADRFAQRAKREAGPKLPAQATRVYRLAYGRTPDKAELALSEGFIEKHGLPAFCRVILNSNEFIHVD